MNRPSATSAQIRSVSIHLPHKSLDLPRFLGPFEPLVQEHIPGDRIDGDEPDGLQHLREIREELGLEQLFLVTGNSRSLLFQHAVCLWCRLAGEMQPPHHPGYDEIPRFDERRGDEREGGRDEPDKYKADSDMLLLLSLLALENVGLDLLNDLRCQHLSSLLCRCGLPGRRLLCNCFALPLVLPLLLFLLALLLLCRLLRGSRVDDGCWNYGDLSLWRRCGKAKRCEDAPCTQEVDGCHSIFHRWVVSRENPEDVEDIMAIISKGKWVHDSVEVDGGEHK